MCLLVFFSSCPNFFSSEPLRAPLPFCAVLALAPFLVYLKPVSHLLLPFFQFPPSPNFPSSRYFTKPFSTFRPLACTRLCCPQGRLLFFHTPPVLRKCASFLSSSLLYSHLFFFIPFLLLPPLLHFGVGQTSPPLFLPSVTRMVNDTSVPLSCSVQPRSPRLSRAVLFFGLGHQVFFALPHFFRK